MSVLIYTDGACKGNPGVGGWGALLQAGDHERELFGGESHTTNNRMELTAVIRALESLKRPSEVDLFTDSQYVKKRELLAWPIASVSLNRTSAPRRCRNGPWRSRASGGTSMRSACGWVTRSV